MAQGDSWVAPVLFPPGNFAEFWADRVTRCRVTCVTLWKPTSVPRPASLVSHATGRSIFNVTRKGVFAKMLPPLVVPPVRPWPRWHSRRSLDCKQIDAVGRRQCRRRERAHALRRRLRSCGTVSHRNDRGLFPRTRQTGRFPIPIRIRPFYDSNGGVRTELEVFLQFTSSKGSVARP